MRAASLFFGVLLLALSAAGAWAQTFKTPEVLIKALYAYDIEKTPESAPTFYTPFFSKDLIALFRTYNEALQGEVGPLEFDPVINGQDGAATNLKIGTPAIQGDKAQVTITFRNGKKVTLLYSLVREQGGWKVDDIAEPNSQYPWRLRKLLE
ncbi:DUF3828 domain-containing protein [Rhizobium sp. FY34]|uniref:DUF3828 domain-containing protein n=1 Tax=Rhizobium sp. FY34 TaxID=2562309 RepID=UPI0010C0D99A|nr:DUF3828 domain-containing protein [Rhizobium sp. FY34]